MSWFCSGDDEMGRIRVWVFVGLGWEQQRVWGEIEWMVDIECGEILSEWGVGRRCVGMREEWNKTAAVVEEFVRVCIVVEFGLCSCRETGESWRGHGHVSEYDCLESVGKIWFIHS